MNPEEIKDRLYRILGDAVPDYVPLKAVDLIDELIKARLAETTPLEARRSGRPLARSPEPRRLRDRG